ncbi:unnamed protein product, partial [Iphiclides podalirius]
MFRRLSWNALASKRRGSRDSPLDSPLSDEVCLLRIEILAWLSDCDSALVANKNCPYGLDTADVIGD